MVEPLTAALLESMGLGAGGLAGFSGTAANFVYHVLCDCGGEVKISSSGSTTYSNIPDNLKTKKVARAQWRGLWFTHSRWFGLRSEEARSAIRRAEVANNERAFQAGHQIRRISLGSLILALPLQIDYDIHRVSLADTINQLEEKAAAISKDLVEAQQKLVSSNNSTQSALKTRKDRGRGKHGGGYIAEDLRKLASHVDALEKQLTVVQRGLKEVGRAARDQRESGVRFMSGFKIKTLPSYLGRDLYIPWNVKAEGTFEVTPVVDANNPHFTIDFTWTEKSPGRKKVWSDTFLWLPDRGPEGSGKFVERFMIGATRIDEQGNGDEEKAEYTKARDEKGREIPYKPRPHKQRPQVLPASRMRQEYEEDRQARRRGGR